VVLASKQSDHSSILYQKKFFSDSSVQ